MASDAALAQLRALQVKINELEERQGVQVLECEKAFFIKCAPLYERRRIIVKGEEEPSVEEAEVEENEPNTEEGQSSNDKKIKGVPHFWLNVLKNQDTIAEHITKRDEKALEYLEDICCKRPRSNPFGYRVEFKFSPNPCFHDKVLVKEVALPYAGAPLSEASLTDASPIKWKSIEENPTVTVTTKANPKSSRKVKGRKAPETEGEKERPKPCPSLFNFFSESTSLRGKRKGTRKGKTYEQAAFTEDEVDIEGIETKEELPDDHLEVLMALWNEVVPKAGELYSFEDSPALQSQLETFDEYEVERPGLETMPISFRRRVGALKYLQSKLTAITKEYKHELSNLDDSFQRETTSIYKERRSIVVGKAESSGNPADMGIPDFWLLALKGCPSTVELIRKRDEVLLRHLSDIRRRKRTVGPGFHIDFEFLAGANLWMEDRVLTKTFILAEEGDELLRTESNSVAWQEDMDVTMKTVATGKGGTKNRPCASFFHLFDQKRKQLLFAGEDTVLLSAAALRDSEAELGVALRETVVPRAVELYEAAKQWDHDEEDDDDDDEDEDENSDDSENDQGDQEVLQRKLKRKGKRRSKGDDDDRICCGLSRNAVFVVLLLLIASSQLFLYLDYIIKIFGY